MEDLSQYYLKRFMKFRMLTEDEERSLWRSFDRKMKVNTLVESHAKLAVKMAFRYKKYNLPINDLVQEGMLGLMRAAEKYRPVKNIRFSSYARWWIRAMMQAFILKNWSIVKNASKGQKEYFMQEHNLSQAVLSKIDQRFRKDLSLNQSVCDDQDLEYLDLLKTEIPSPEDSILEEQDSEYKAELMKEVFKVLKPIERKILRMRFYDRKTNVEGAKKLDLTLGQFNQMQQSALRKLFFHLKENIHLLKNLH